MRETYDATVPLMLASVVLIWFSAVIPSQTLAGQSSPQGVRR